MFTIKIVEPSKNDRHALAGKLADVELHFDTGLLEGLKLVGFTVWERRTGGGRNVTFPARQYTVNGDRRTFALLRPGNGDATSQDRIREAILETYAEWEHSQPVASGQ